ncbi:MAG: FAD-dependent oxidoreductase [Archangium sp.]|nr:FAD-dependent oxidoreductase [Archangium sp.]
MKATQPLWASARLDRSFSPPPPGPLSVDVVIVGGGITGLTSALLLKRAGKRVAVLEARHILDGVSGATTAHLTQMLDTRYHVLEDRFGEEGTRQVAASNAAAIELIELITRELKIDCGFARVPGFLFAETQAQRDELEEELHAVLRAGMNAAAQGAPPLPFPVKLAVRVENQAQLHPLKYLVPIAHEIHSHGSFVIEHAPVTAVHDGTPCSVETSTGLTVTAPQVIIATHSPLNRVLLLTKLAHYRSYVISGPVPKAMDGLLWDMADPYHYVRTHQTRRGPQLVIGGEDHKTGQEPDTEGAFERLTEYAKRYRMVPTRRWSAQVVETVDGLPFIGRNSGSTNVLAATGFSGNGFTFGTLAAMILTDRVLGRPNPWTDLYDATRIKPLASLKSYITENIDFPFYFVSGAIKPPDVLSVADVGVNEGKIVRVDGKQLAVFRDGGGDLHAVSSVCTHLGCHVGFNSAQKSWDCPCHGSRFSVDGEVLDGPAVKPLQRHDIDDDDDANITHADAHQEAAQ